MEDCHLRYIPDRLHWRNKDIIKAFEVGDLIYRRCKEEELQNPYKGLSPLCDISHNIGTCCQKVLSEEEDVLFSIKDSEDFEKYEKVTYCLKIVSLNENAEYSKRFEEIKNGNTYVGKIALIHDPVPCMYPHCIFRVWLNEEIVTRSNYQNGLKKLNILKDRIRHELTTMIFRREIDQNHYRSR